MGGGEDSYPLNRVSSMAFDSLQEFQQLHPTHSRIPQIVWSVVSTLAPSSTWVSQGKF